MNTRPPVQTGAVLLLALLFLLLLSVLVTSTTHSSTLQLRMAGNEQARLQARQRVLAVLDGLLDNPDHFPSAGEVGDRICGVAAGDGSCDARLLQLRPGLVRVPAGSRLHFHVLRRGPLETDWPGTGGEPEADGVVYKAAHYEVVVDFDGSGAGLASSSMSRGVMVKVPAQVQPEPTQQLMEGGQVPGGDDGDGDAGGQATEGAESRSMWKVYWRESGVDRL